MGFLHVGWKESKRRCGLLQDERNSQPTDRNYVGISLIAIRIAVIAFTWTLSLWVSDIEKLAPIGAALVVAQLMLRKVGAIYLCKSQCAAKLASSKAIIDKH